MATYTFEAITAAEALAFTSADTLVFAAGSSAKTTAVFYLADGGFSLTAGARTVVFSQFLPENVGRLMFPDKSTLFLGGAEADTRDSGVIPSTGAMYGGDGADTLTGSPGDWFVQGNQGDDRIIVRSQGANTAYGGQGNDNLSVIGASVNASQFMQGNKGDDTLQGGAGADTLLGGQGDDRIAGSGGLDVINGNLGDDQIEGGGLLFGEAGADTIRGGETSDRIDGGAGADSLSGGAAADVFIQTSSSAALTLAAADRIGDWAAEDKIQLRAAIGTAYAEATAADFAAALTTAQAQIGAGQIEAVAVQVGADVIVFADASPGTAIDTITVLVGRTLADISASNFV